ncbi:hypothetical protein K440DRAFT_644082 [Wilcoxina mikolae CBS 423.85]|nr:hypothetical protein K440DRAFT_644082 [Wilcoxina mikolae CBS 423.85]
MEVKTEVDGSADCGQMVPVPVEGIEKGAYAYASCCGRRWWDKMLVVSCWWWCLERRERWLLYRHATAAKPQFGVHRGSSYADPSDTTWHIALLQDAGAQLSERPNFNTEKRFSPSSFASAVKGLPQSLSNVFLRSVITTFKYYIAVYISYPTNSSSGPCYRHRLRLGQSDASFCADSSILLARRRKNYPLHPTELDGPILTVFCPLDGNKRPPPRADYSRESGCLVALAQEYFHLKSTATSCDIAMLSIRPHARVAFVTAVVEKEYLEALEAGKYPSELKICVSRLYDMTDSAERVGFAGVWLDMVEVLVRRRVKVEVGERKAANGGEVPAKDVKVPAGSSEG